MDRKITAIIACYKDAQAIPFMYRRLVDVFTRIGVDYEIIFVNDSSPDNAREVLEDLTAQDSKVIAINHSRNFGSQNAFTSGMRISSGDAVVLLDGDLQDPPEVIEHFYYKWLEGFDVVYGVRIKREANLFLNIAYKAFYRVFKYMSYVNIPVDAGDFSLIDRKVVTVINSLPENNRFMRGLRAWTGFKQTGVEYFRPERMFGKSTNSLIKNMAWARKAIFSFSYVPMDFMIVLALFFLFISFILASVQITMKLLHPESSPSGYTTLLLVTIFMGSVQLLCFAIIGSYIAHMYDEIKRRPPYIVESYINYSPKKTSQENDTSH
ncbi:glycosyltransferase family 2 protein [Candidatus Magnetomonas plexicatena]|uniref:glycosyltransferase family 2 protein n=1 Tax=Candidatus Magnetomonas plexicatena TaxID=2552947 RepID=UPI001C789ED3|nr:glycosyltransferase family 2 protein [Nitrospirales bacterium LBB_01]